MIRTIVNLFAILLTVVTAAQGQGLQLWLDYDLNYQFAKTYLFETEVSYQTLMGDQEQWRSINLTPTFEKRMSRSIDVTLAFPLSYTQQNNEETSTEVRISAGMRYNITPTKRIQTKATVKWESRFFYSHEDGTWDRSNRFRLKYDARTGLNGRMQTPEKLIYVLLEVEAFIVNDQDVEERYANRLRLTGGGGYKLNVKSRLELIYMFQESRNKSEDSSFSVDDSIIRLRFRHFLAQPIGKR